jgi:hypothetical protein
MPLANEILSHYISSMSQNAELDRILAALAQPLAQLADTLLDLRLWALSPSRAGSCVKAYFDLVAEAPASEEVAHSLLKLRNWLEVRLNILVFNSRRTVCLETLPLALAGQTDLEEFCHTAMRRLREDRCRTEPDLRMEFGFSQDSAAAA